MIESEAAFLEAKVEERFEEWAKGWIDLGNKDRSERRDQEAIRAWNVMLGTDR